MSNKPKPYGRYDSEYLDTVVEECEEMTRLLQAIVGRLGRLPQPVAMMFQEAGFRLSTQRAALAKMEVIRSECKRRPFPQQ